MSFKILLKILAIGLITTVCRIIAQMLIPEGDQSILEPSRFAENGTMPIAFSIYGIFVYSVIASMYVLLRDKLKGRKIVQGLKYGISCSAIWIIYLLEPLPHVNLLDKITYPLADSIPLLIMGGLCGVLLKKDSQENIGKKQFQPAPFISIILFFVIGRIIQYKVINIYSSFDTKVLETLLWSTITGICISLVIIWFYNYIPSFNTYSRALILGGILFGVNILLFNFFMPLVFNADIPDLFVRTGIDVFSVTTGCLFFRDFDKSSNLQTKPNKL